MIIPSTSIGNEMAGELTILRSMVQLTLFPIERLKFVINSEDCSKCVYNILFTFNTTNNYIK